MNSSLTLRPKRAQLREPKMMGVGWLSSAYQAWTGGDVFDVVRSRSRRGSGSESAPLSITRDLNASAIRGGVLRFVIPRGCRHVIEAKDLEIRKFGPKRIVENPRIGTG